MESKTRVLGWGTKISKPCCRIQDWNVCVGVSFFQTLRDDVTTVTLTFPLKCQCAVANV